MSQYEEELTHKLFEGHLSPLEIGQIEEHFTGELQKYNFKFYKEEVNDEFKKATNKIFRHSIYPQIFLNIITVTDVDEYDDFKYSTWGNWILCDEEGNTLYFFSENLKPNITILEGAAIGCNGFWLEGLENIPQFIKIYLESKT
jgi:hypothetical protein